MKADIISSDENKLPYGPMPSYWEIKQLIQCASYVDYRGKTPIKTESGRFLVTAKNVRFGYIDYESSKEYISEKDYESVMRRGKPKVGDILITTEAPLGNIAEVDREDIALAQRVIKYRAKPEIIDHRFLKYFLSSDKFQELLKLKSTGSTAKGIKGSVLHRLPIGFPPLPEQKAIASVLSLVDSAIKKTKQLIAQKELQKIGLMQRLLMGKKRLRGLNGEWKKTKLEKVTEKIGSGITPAGGQLVYKDEGRPFVRSQNVGWGALILDDISFIDERTHKSFLSTEIRPGDVFLNITGASIGRSAVSNNSVVGGNVNQHVCIIRTLKSSLSPHYLNYFLLSERGQKQIDSYQAGGNRQGLNFEQIKSFRINLPSLSEQNAITQILQTADREIYLLKSKAGKLQEQKKGMMQVLLTGKKRLKGFRS